MIDAALLSALDSRGMIPAHIIPSEGLAFVQPPSVLRQLGRRFERLKGPEVVDVLGMHLLLVSSEYRWPASLCTSDK